jgi:hypothetical protein
MRFLGLGLVLATLAACSQAQSIQAGSAINGGVVAISQAGTYHYSFEHGSWPWILLRSDGGATDELFGSGSIYLTPGNWSGVTGWFADEPTCPGFVSVAGGFCPSAPSAWSLMLTSP